MDLVKPGGIDLHVHSSFSDGVYTPQELVTKSEKLGLRAISITDHDDLRAHLDGPLSSSRVKVIPGIELSTVTENNTEVHMLGYYIDPRHEEFRIKIDSLREARESRCRNIISRVNDALIDFNIPYLLDYQVVRKINRGALGRPHIAQALIKNGVVETVQEAFEHFLIPYNLPKAYFPIQEAVALIRSAHGIPVLAHPARMLEPPELLPQIIEQLLPLGLMGIEVFTPSSSPEEQQKLAELAKTYKLLTTGGSDYHGPHVPKKLGQPFIDKMYLDKLIKAKQNQLVCV